MNIPVLYEDDCLIVFNKPAGLLVIPSPRHEGHTMVDIVNEQRQRASGPGVVGHEGQSPAALHPCHRLDRETSGVILFAKGKKQQQVIMRMFAERQVKKTYLAFVRGRLPHKKGEIDFPVGDPYRGQGRFRPARSSGNRRGAGQPALTRYRVLRAEKEFSVVEVNPETGRKNQIRIHFKQLGHPLLGERVYAFRKDFTVHTRRLALHALRVELAPPHLGRSLVVEAPLADDLQEFLDTHQDMC